MTEAQAPWYRQPWLWFIVSPLIFVVCAGFFMIYLSIATNDGVVVDNFYKDGLSLIVREQQDEFARDKQLKANLTFDQQRLTLKLTGNLDQLPKQLNLLIIFPTQQDRDEQVLLTASGNLYTGVMPANLTGRRYLQLQPVNSETASWRLHAETYFPISSPLELIPRQAPGS